MDPEPIPAYNSQAPPDREGSSPGSLLKLITASHPSFRISAVPFILVRGSDPMECRIAPSQLGFWSSTVHFSLKVTQGGGESDSNLIWVDFLSKHL